MPSIGDLYATLGLDTKPFKKALHNLEPEAQKQSKRVGRALSWANAGLNAAGVGLLGAAAAAGGALSFIGRQAYQVSNQMRQGATEMAADLGITAESAANLAEVARNVWENNWGEQVSSVIPAVSAVHRVLGFVGDQAQAATENLMTLDDAFGVDYQDALQAVGVLMAMGAESNEAFDFVTRGFQSGLDSSGDFLESITEYAPQFKQMGFDADQLWNLFQQGAASGVLGLDKISDATKEFRLRFTEQTKDVAAANEALGLDSVWNAFRQGSITGADAMQQVIDALGGVDDAWQRHTMGVAYFGTQWEDLGEEIILGVDTWKDSTADWIFSIDTLKERYNTLQASLESVRRKAVVAFTPLIERVRERIMTALEPVKDYLDTYLKEAVEKFVAETLPMMETKAVEIATAATEGIKTVWTKLVEWLSPGGEGYAMLETALFDQEGELRSWVLPALALAFMTPGGIEYPIMLLFGPQIIAELNKNVPEFQEGFTGVISTAWENAVAIWDMETPMKDRILLLVQNFAQMFANIEWASVLEVVEYVGDKVWKDLLWLSETDATKIAVNGVAQVIASINTTITGMEGRLNTWATNLYDFFFDVDGFRAKINKDIADTVTSEDVTAALTAAGPFSLPTIQLSKIEADNAILPFLSFGKDHITIDPDIFHNLETYWTSFLSRFTVRVNALKTSIESFKIEDLKTRFTELQDAVQEVDWSLGLPEGLNQLFTVAYDEGTKLIDDIKTYMRTNDLAVLIRTDMRTAWDAFYSAQQADIKRWTKNIELTVRLAFMRLKDDVIAQWEGMNTRAVELWEDVKATFQRGKEEIFELKSTRLAKHSLMVTIENWIARIKIEFNKWQTTLRLEIKMLYLKWQDELEMGWRNLWANFGTAFFMQALWRIIYDLFRHQGIWTIIRGGIITFFTSIKAWLKFYLPLMWKGIDLQSIPKAAIGKQTLFQWISPQKFATASDRAALLLNFKNLANDAGNRFGTNFKKSWTVFWKSSMNELRLSARSLGYRYGENFWRGLLKFGTTSMKFTNWIGWGLIITDLYNWLKSEGHWDKFWDETIHDWIAYLDAKVPWLTNAVRLLFGTATEKFGLLMASEFGEGFARHGGEALTLAQQGGLYGWELNSTMKALGVANDNLDTWQKDVRSWQFYVGVFVGQVVKWGIGLVTVIDEIVAASVNFSNWFLSNLWNVWWPKFKEFRDDFLDGWKWFMANIVPLFQQYGFWGGLWRALGIWGQQIGDALWQSMIAQAPHLVPIANWFANQWNILSNLIATHPQGFHGAMHAYVNIALNNFIAWILDILKAGWTTISTAAQTWWQTAILQPLQATSWWGPLTTALGAIWGFIGAYFQSTPTGLIWNIFTQGWGPAWAQFQQRWQTNFQNFWNAVTTMATTAWNAIMTTLRATSWWQPLMNALGAIWSWLQAYFQSTPTGLIWNIFTQGWGPAWAQFQQRWQTNFQNFWNAVTTMATTAWNAIMGTLQATTWWQPLMNALGAIGQFLSGQFSATPYGLLWNTIMHGWPAAWNMFTSQWQSNWNWFKVNVLDAIMVGLGNAFQAFWTYLQNLQWFQGIQNFWDNTIKPILSWFYQHTGFGIFNWFVQGPTVTQAQAQANWQTTINGIVQAIWDAIQNAWDTIVKPNIPTMFQGLLGGFTGQATPAATAGGAPVQSAFGSFGLLLTALLSQPVKDAVDEVKTELGKIGTYVQDAINTMTTKLTDMKDVIVTKFGEITTWLTDQRDMIKTKLVDMFDRAKNGIMVPLSNLVILVKGWGSTIKGIDWLGIGKSIVTGIVDGIKNNATKVKDAITDAVSDAKDRTLEFLGISSPSRVFAQQIGRPIAQGLIGGFRDEIDGSFLGRDFLHRFEAVDAPHFGGGVTFNITINAPSGDGQDIAEAFRPVARESFETWQRSIGAL